MTQIISRIILALSLLAGTAPAIAQAPSPVPALPDAERRTSYSISASTCACSVGFALFGDGSDYASWVEVWINGARYDYNDPINGWKITSPSGPIANLARPITDAVLTFTAAQTGTVQIVGARRPRRTSQFSENRGVAARDLNQAITDLVATLRENWDKTNDVTGRAVMGRPGETLALLPALANRRNQGACFDSNGNLTSCVGIPSSSLTAGNGIALTGANPTTITNNIQAGSGITISGANPLVISATPALQPYVMPATYGAKCDGVTDDTTAIQAMLTASSGKTVFFPAATCIVSTTTLSVPSNITVTGAGRDVSIIKTLSCVPLLTVSNVSNVTIENLWLQGSDACVSWAVSSIGAINFGASVTSANWTFRNLKQTGFNSNYWNYGNAAASISNVTFDNISVETASGDVPTVNGASGGSNIGMAFFSGLGGIRWENLTVKNTQFNGADLCIHAIIFGNAYKHSFLNNRFLSPGSNNSSSHCTNAGPATNAYCFSVYDANDDGNPSSDGIFANNYCLNPKASGVYVVGSGTTATRAATTTPLLISGNEISGQSNTDTLLPRGAISVSLATDVTIVGNRLSGNATGINLTAQNSGDVSVLSNDCSSVAGGSICLNLQAGSNGSSNTDRRIIRGNYFEASGNSVVLVSSAGARFNEVDLSGNTIVAIGAGSGAGLLAAPVLTSGVIGIRNNNFSGQSSTAMLGIGTQTGNFSFAGNTFTVPSTGTSGILFTGLPSATNGSDIFVQDGSSGSSPCTSGGTGARAFRQNGAWKCF